MDFYWKKIGEELIDWLDFKQATRRYLNLHCK